MLYVLEQAFVAASFADFHEFRVRFAGQKPPCRVSFLRARFAAQAADLRDGRKLDWFRGWRGAAWVLPPASEWHLRDPRQRCGPVWVPDVVVRRFAARLAPPSRSLPRPVDLRLVGRVDEALPRIVDCSRRQAVDLGKFQVLDPDEHRRTRERRVRAVIEAAGGLRLPRIESHFRVRPMIFNQNGIVNVHLS